MLVLARPPVAARGRYSGHIAPTCVCAAAAALQRWWCQMADLGVGLLAPPLPQPPVPIVQISDICTIYVETRGRECPYRPRGGFISMEPILASGTAQETSNFLKRDILILQRLNMSPSLQTGSIKVVYRWSKASHTKGITFLMGPLQARGKTGSFMRCAELFMDVETGLYSNSTTLTLGTCRNVVSIFRNCSTRRSGSCLEGDGLKTGNSNIAFGVGGH